jgi:hypothetical protein
MEIKKLLEIIEREQLLLRPALFGGWWCSEFKGVTGVNKAYCTLKSIGQGETIPEAVKDYLDKNVCEHDFSIKGYRNQCSKCGMFDYTDNCG